MTSGIIEILIENVALINLIGLDNLSQIKIYPVIAPQGVIAPYIVVSEARIIPTQAKGCPEFMDNATYQVLVYSTDFLQTEQIQDACRDALDNGQQWDTDAGAHFDAIYMTDRRDMYDQGPGQDGGMFVKVGIYEAVVKRAS